MQNNSVPPRTTRDGTITRLFFMTCSSPGSMRIQSTSRVQEETGLYPWASDTCRWATKQKQVCTLTSSFQIRSRVGRSDGERRRRQDFTLVGGLLSTNRKTALGFSANPFCSLILLRTLQCTRQGRVLEEFLFRSILEHTDIQSTRPHKPHCLTANGRF